MEERRRLTVKSDDEAFDLLEAALRHEVGDQPIELIFDQWPKLQVRLVGEGFDSSISPDLAQAMVDFQQALNRAYARFVHNSANARVLTAEEKASIEFRAKVESGSSLVTFDLGKFGETLSNALVAKMTPEMIVVSVLGLGLLGAGYLSYKAFLSQRTKEKEISSEAEKLIALSTQETERMKILASALKVNKDLGGSASDFDQVRGQIVKSGIHADSVSVGGLSIDAETAKVVAISKRSGSVETQMNGAYQVLATDLRQTDFIKLRIRRVQDGFEFVATFEDQSLERAQIRLLQEAEWGRKQVFLSINAVLLRDEVTKATVISVREIVEPAA
ncbi:hypothetical protein [Burkholderia diffusa]|uniref:hypothetical protein n=1 Tax=Burkholderia diffusa TaxID=488732 RepID=UPI002AB0A08D|nr:hypothetical protein [Burkholderia diffusa]